MDMNQIAYDLYGTPLAEFIRSVSWLIPTVQSIHILAISILAGSALVMELRIAGVWATSAAPRAVVQRFLPWLWGALAVLLLTGLTLTIAEPNRVLNNSIFWYKMAAIVGAFVLTLVFRYPILRTDAGGAEVRLGGLTKLSAWLTLAAWIFAIYCGRWIAYAL